MRKLVWKGAAVGGVLLLSSVPALAQWTWDPNDPQIPAVGIPIPQLLGMVVTTLGAVLGACFVVGMGFFIARRGISWVRGAFR